MERDESLSGIPSIGGPEGAFSPVVFIRGIGRKLAISVWGIISARGVFEAVKQRGSNPFGGFYVWGTSHARGKIPAQHDDVDLIGEIFFRNVVRDGGEQLVLKLIGRDGDQICGDVDVADVMGGNAVLSGIVLAQLNGVGGVRIHDHERVEGSPAGKENRRRDHQG